MGRSTYESIGNKLKFRKNIILTRNQNFYANDCTIVNSAIDCIKHIFPYYDLFVIGGAQIYKYFYNYSSYLFITKINGNFVGDVFFPNINPRKWILLNTIYRKNYSLNIYKRKLTI